jgi:hypothetical protein
LKTKRPEAITIEPYFYEPLKEIPKILYNVTASVHLDKILKLGLVPKTKSRK